MHGRCVMRWAGWLALGFLASSAGAQQQSDDLRTGQNGVDGRVTIYSEEGGTDQTTTIQPPADMTQDVVYSLPVDDGAPGQFLQTDGGGILSWVTSSGSGDITDVGPNCASGACFTDGTNHTLLFEGATNDTIESTLGATNPTTGDQIYNLPNAAGAGTFVLIAGISIESSTSAASSTGPKTQTTTCAANRQVIGGGCLLNSEDADVALQETYPSGSPANAWNCTANEGDATTASWSVTTYAVCAHID